MRKASRSTFELKLGDGKKEKSDTHKSTSAREGISGNLSEKKKEHVMGF